MQAVENLTEVPEIRRFLAAMARSFGDPPTKDLPGFIADLQADLGDLSPEEWQALPGLIRQSHKSRSWPTNAVMLEILRKHRAAQAATAGPAPGMPKWADLRRAWGARADDAAAHYLAHGALAPMARAEGWADQLRRYTRSVAFEAIRARIQAQPCNASKLAAIEAFDLDSLTLSLDDRAIAWYRAQATGAGWEVAP